MPIMDVFRQHWPEVELDLVSGFHSDPIKLLEDGSADVVIGSEHKQRRGIIHRPLFRFEILAVLAPEHGLRRKRILQAVDFANETHITYPVPERPHRSGPKSIETCRHSSAKTHSRANCRNFAVGS